MHRQAAPPGRMRRHDCGFDQVLSDAGRWPATIRTPFASRGSGVQIPSAPPDSGKPPSAASSVVRTAKTGLPDPLGVTCRLAIADLPRAPVPSRACRRSTGRDVTPRQCPCQMRVEFSEICAIPIGRRCNLWRCLPLRALLTLWCTCREHCSASHRGYRSLLNLARSDRPSASLLVLLKNALVFHFRLTIQEPY